MSMQEDAGRFLRRLRSEPGYGTEYSRWRDVSNVLWFYGVDRPQAFPPSGFKDLLIKAMDRADSENLARFWLAFPDVAMTMWTCKNVPGGTQALADALAEAEQIDTPTARAIIGTLVHTPHHGKTDKACHPENGERRVHIGDGEYVIVGAPLEGPIPAGTYVIRGHGRVRIEESSLTHVRNPVVVPDPDALPPSGYKVCFTVPDPVRDPAGDIPPGLQDGA